MIWSNQPAPYLDAVDDPAKRTLNAGTVPLILAGSVTGGFLDRSLFATLKLIGDVSTDSRSGFALRVIPAVEWWPVGWLALRGAFEDALKLDTATAKRLGIPWEVSERDYLLSWVLAGIGQVDSFRETLVFKGGTALKKCYFGDYRFSEAAGRARSRGDRLRALHRKAPAPGRPEGLHDPRALLVAEATADARHDRDRSGREDPQASARRPGASGSARWCPGCLASRP